MTFKEFVAGLAREDLKLSPAEVSRMRKRFGDKVLQMGHLEEDGSMLVPVECVLKAAQELGAAALTEAAESMSDETMVSMVRSGEAFVDQVVRARDDRLRKMVRSFQDQPDAGKSARQWKQIEKEIFGVEFKD